jgi:hypothetical protein
MKYIASPEGGSPQRPKQTSPKFLHSQHEVSFHELSQALDEVQTSNDNGKSSSAILLL